MEKSPRTPRALIALTVLAALLLAGCGGDTDGGASDSPSSDHNDADVAFAGDMIQHHAQALAMVDLTVGRDLDPEVELLAEAIRAAQAPEIEAMTDWLTEWGEPVPATVNDHVNADGDHGDHDTEDAGEGEDLGMDMPGMMSEDELAELEAAPDPEFQDLFLAMMIEHHEGAIEMADDQRSEGRYPPAVDLAEQIATTQAAEIETMQGLLS
jgi:uncharacterized protein (DUF305 family)